MQVVQIVAHSDHAVGQRVDDFNGARIAMRLMQVVLVFLRGNNNNYRSWFSTQHKGRTTNCQLGDFQLPIPLASMLITFQFHFTYNFTCIIDKNQ